MASIRGHFVTVNRIDYLTTKTALLGLPRAVSPDAREPRSLAARSVREP
jgi:hypothetical protein